jgi:Phosphatidylinositol-4-phosphate 5-Kinase
MFPLERALSAIAVAQAVFMTLQAGIRVYEDGIRTKKRNPRLPVPVLEPHSAVGDDRHDENLHRILAAFRQGVKLGLRQEEYESKRLGLYRVIHTHEEREETAEPYRMSLVPALVKRAKQTEEEEDERIDLPELFRTSKAGATESSSTFETDSENKKDDDDTMDFDTSYVTDYALDSTTTARIHAYAPKTFQILRSSYGVSDLSFCETFLRHPYVPMLSNSKGAARTGGLFCRTHDSAYVIKTIKHDEMHTLLNDMLPSYVQYMQENGRQTLLARFCGLYKVQTRRKHSDGDYSDSKPLYFVIMNSVFPRVYLQERYDLKGSTLGRRTSLKDREKMGSSAVLKDLNLMAERDRAKEAPMRIGPASKSALMAQLHQDVELLQNCGVIDYSLLVGVQLGKESKCSLFPRRKLQNMFRLRRGRCKTWKNMMLHRFYRHRHKAVDGGPCSISLGERHGKEAVYYIGMIDFLQPFDVKKLAEYKLKGLIHKKDTFSCIPPDLYAERFLDFVDKHFA